MIYLSSDHAGFHLKLQILSFLTLEKISYFDLGPFEFIKEDDYPLYAQSLAERMKADKDSMGILVCRSGEGMEIAANRFKWIRAALCNNKNFAKLSREEDDANVLVLSAMLFEDNEEYKEIIKTFINTKFKNIKRYRRRVKEMS
ncbi:MAG: RpiB/LacA/LacB family sugar-phosphate isomerase [Patescibacteria group bacterium]